MCLKKIKWGERKNMAKKKNKNRKKVLISVLILVIIALGTGVYLFQTSKDDNNKVSTSEILESPVSEKDEEDTDNNNNTQSSTDNNNTSNNNEEETPSLVEDNSSEDTKLEETVNGIVDTNNKNGSTSLDNASTDGEFTKSKAIEYLVCSDSICVNYQLKVEDGKYYFLKDGKKKYYLYIYDKENSPVTGKDYYGYNLYDLDQGDNVSVEFGMISENGYVEIE